MRSLLVAPLLPVATLLPPLIVDPLPEVTNLRPPGRVLVCAPPLPVTSEPLRTRFGTNLVALGVETA